MDQSVEDQTKLGSPADSVPIETELKLALSEQELSRLRRHPLLQSLKQGRASTQHLQSIYFDTPDHQLRKHGLALRIRQDGEHRLQTLKAEGRSPSGLLSRNEWECEVDGDVPDLAAIEEPRLEQALAAAEAGEQGLLPVFRTDIRRTKWMLRLIDGSEVELALDVGEVAAGERRLPISEAELELKSGQPQSLFEIARALHGDVPFRIETRAKSARGYALAAAQEHAPSKAPPVLLDPEMSVEAALKAIVGTCLLHLEVNEGPALQGADPEGIHQMRVALRRLRSALNLFRPVLSEETLVPLKAELKWLAGSLGPARDWDVFTGETIAPLRARLPDEAALDVLAEVAEQVRLQGYETARASITAPRFTGLKLAFGAWIAAEDWPRRLPPGQAERLGRPVKEFADGVLKKRHKQLIKAGDLHHELSLPELHQLRIRAKKMRYAAEFFRSLYGGRKLKRYLRRMSRLQDLLGTINDAAVSRSRLDEAAAAADAGTDRRMLDRADALVTGWLAQRVDHELPTFAACWPEFAKSRRFWDKPGSH